MGAQDEIKGTKINKLTRLNGNNEGIRDDNKTGEALDGQLEIEENGEELAGGQVLANANNALR